MMELLGGIVTVLGVYYVTYYLGIGLFYLVRALAMVSIIIIKSPIRLCKILAEC